ncbi:MAG: phosphatidylinositol-specific phospholipase C domain-containing protein [Bacilli bacterium]
MNKHVKRVIIILGSVVGVLGAMVLGLFLNGTDFQKYSDNEIDKKDWMSSLKDETLINGIIMPGSHDSGTNTMSWLGQTQTYSVKEQLQIGVRYFDLRVNKKGEDDLIIYHDIIDGSDFEPIISDISKFLSDNQSETVLLDFQHFKNESQNDVKGLIDEYLTKDGLVIKNETSDSDLKFVSELTLGQCRGKCLIFFGDYSLDSNYDYGNNIFSRNNDECSFENMSLDSCYLSSYHKGNSQDFIDEALPEYFKRIKEKKERDGDKGIFVLQCQLTDGKLIFGPYSREKSHDSNISEYIASLKDNADFSLVNVVLRDFFTGEKSAQIISLNNYKDNLKETLRDNTKNLIFLENQYGKMHNREN